MASAEAASSLSSGPHYAPEDPTLPKPWKGLIDGRTGTLYYWNPEANVTQYDRPISLNPPLPPGPPPTASIPKMVPIPVSGTLSSNDSLLQPQESAGQQLPIQNSQQLPYHQSQSVVNQQMPVQNSHQLPYQHSLSIANQQMPVQNAQQLPYHQSHSVINQQMQQQYPQLQLQMSQYPQVSYLQGQLTGLSQIPYQQPQQQGSQFSYQQQPQRSQQSQQPQQPQQLQQQQGSQASFQQQQKPQGSIGPYQQQQQLQVSNIPFQMGQQQLQGSGASHQQGQQQPESKQTDAYQQVKQPQGQQIGGVVFDYLKQQPESKQTDAYQLVKQPQGQQIGVLRMESEQQDASLMPSNRPLSGVVTQAQVSKMGFGSVKEQQQQFGGPASAKKPLGGLPSKFTGPSSGGQQFNETYSGGQKISGPSFQNDACFRQEKIKGFNQEGQPMVRSMGIQLGNEEDQRERSGNQFTSFNRNEILMLPARQPKLASLPRCQEWKLQGMQSGDVKAHFVSSGQSSGLNMPPGNAVTNFYDHPPFPTAAPMRPPQRMFGASEFTNSTPVDAYRQHHEITARGDNIPAPFMTFEATGFPPEILREM